MAESVSPTFLIASPQMRDPFFERTVVLVWHHTEDDGATGVVVNRTLDRCLPDLLELDDGVDLSVYSATRVAWGGPVETASGTVITPENLAGEDDGLALPGGLGVTQSHHAMVRLLRAKAEVMLCLGYARWAPGQLDREIEQGGWLFTDCDARIVFETPAEDRYDRALASLGLTPTTVWMQPIDE